MIRIEDLKTGILEIPFLEVPKGLTILSGDNGAGKTTLLKLSAGVLLPKQGTILINGKTPRNTEVGYVSEFPDRHLLFSRVRDEISSPLLFMHKSPDEIQDALNEVAEKFLITHLLDRSTRTLSGGEKILVGTAAAIISSPELLVLDEPDSHLDPKTRDELLMLITSAKIPHILWSSHSGRLHDAADTHIRLNCGRVES